LATRCSVFSWTVPDFLSFAPTLGIMLKLGAGIDYALLIGGRDREQLASGGSVSHSGVPCARWKRRTTRNVAKTPSARCRTGVAGAAPRRRASAQPPSRGLGQTVGSASATHAAELLHQRLAGLSIRPRGGSQCNAVGERGPGRSQAFAS
jgi:hypothetical protein